MWRIFFFFTFKRKLWKVVPYHEISVPRMLYRMTTLRQAVENKMKKYSLHLIFTFYLNRVTLVLVIVPFVVFYQNHLFNQPVLTHWLATETVSKIVWSRYPKWRSYQYICLQTRPHIMTINQHNNIEHAFSAAQLIRNVSTYWQFFYYRLPGEFLYSGRGR